VCLNTEILVALVRKIRCFGMFLSYWNANSVLLSNMGIEYLQRWTILTSENSFQSQNGPIKMNRSSVHIRLWVQKYETMNFVGDRGNRFQESHSNKCGPNVTRMVEHDPKLLGGLSKKQNLLNRAPTSQHSWLATPERWPWALTSHLPDHATSISHRVHAVEWTCLLCLLRFLQVETCLGEILFEVGKNFYWDVSDVEASLWRGLFKR
jgi:hypothetical protein